MNSNNNLHKLKRRLTSENERARIQFLCTYAVFGTVAIIMTVMNAITGWKPLMYITLTFGVLNIINLLLSIRPSKMEHVARAMFAAEVICLFTVFIICGAPEGFSAIWIAILPALGLLLYGIKFGSLISVVMFLELIFFFQIPYGQGLLQYAYTQTFMMRFPVMYIAFYLAGLMFELIRSFTQEELNRSRNKYIKLSYTDQLTGLGNESYYIRRIGAIEKSIAEDNAKFAVIFLDVNNVKGTNDKYGHRYGCYLIVTTGKILPKIFKTSDIFHIGGDEFVVIATGDDYDHLGMRLNTLGNELRYKKIIYENTEIILSVAYGHAVYRRGDKYTSVMQRADDNMYISKREMKKKYDISIR